MNSTLAGVAQWIELQTKGFAGSIPSQGTCLGCRPGPQWGPHERQPHIDISLSLSPSLPLSLKINKYKIVNKKRKEKRQKNTLLYGDEQKILTTDL